MAMVNKIQVFKGSYLHHNNHSIIFNMNVSIPLDNCDCDEFAEQLLQTFMLHEELTAYVMRYVGTRYEVRKPK